jgi:hypothetical protein
MKMWGPFRFALWYGRSDLRSGWGITWVAVANIALLSGFSLLVFGLANGWQRVREDRLLRDPLALCLLVGDGQAGRPVDEALLGQLRAEVEARLRLTPGALLGCYPFRVVGFDFFPVQATGTTPSQTGRTLAAGDPLLLSRRPRVGRGFETPDEFGLVVTPRFLSELGADPAAPPAQLNMRSHTGKPFPVALLGVTEDDLPLGLHFVVTEKCFDYLRTHDPNPNAEAVKTGPVPRAWPDLDELPELLDNALSDAATKLQIRYPLQAAKRDGVPCWRLDARAGESYSLEEWRTKVEALHGVLVRLKYLESKEFQQAYALGPVAEGKRRAEPYDRVGVYVRELEHLGPVVEAAETVGLPVNKSVYLQLKGFERQVSVVRKVLLVVVSFFAGAALVNLGLIQYLRQRPKRPEVGMLKAMGVSPSHLRGVFVAEAAIIWVRGLVVGALGSLLFGWGTSYFLAEAPSERWLGFAPTWDLALWVSGGAALACLASTGLVAWLDARKPALQLLSQA